MADLTAIRRPALRAVCPEPCGVTWTAPRGDRQAAVTAVPASTECPFQGGPPCKGPKLMVAVRRARSSHG